MNTLTLIDPELELALKGLQTRIGNTPLVGVKRVYQNPKVQILAKLEWQQLGASVKARPAFNIIKQAILNGELDRSRRLLDASSGNTAIAYAHIGAALGIPVTIILPENASAARKLILKNLGVELIFSSPFGGTDEAQELAKELYQKNPDLYFYADQYGNPNNWKAHFEYTAKEIWEQTQGQVTHLVAGLGTTGTFTGTTRGLKAFNPNIKAIALQPESALHGLEGWKDLETAKVPAIYDDQLADQVLQVDTFEAYKQVRQAAKLEGFLISPSAGANLAGAIALADQIEEGVIVTFFADSADKYAEVMNQIFA